MWYVRKDEEDETQGHPGKTREELDEIHPRLRRAAVAAIRVLKDAGIRRVDALPYAPVLPPLMHFFDKFPAPHPDSVARGLRRFVWLVAAGGARQQQRGTYQRAAARFIREHDDAKSAIDKLVAYSEIDVDGAVKALMRVRHDWRSAATRLVALALFELDPMELTEGGTPIPVWEVLPEKGDELFRYIWSEGTNKLFSSTANRVISAELGSILERLADTEQLNQGELFPRTVISYGRHLESQAITPAALLALQRGDRTTFLKLRATRITEVVENFLRTRLGG